jgi:hypothetical protein
MTLIRPVAFGEGLLPELGSLFSQTTSPTASLPSLSSGWIESRALHDLKTGVPSYQDEEGRIHLLIHMSIEEQNEHRWCL